MDAHRRKDAAARRRNGTKKGFKVVYISSPIKVNTCASNFRALVQELTGKDSDSDAAAAAAATTRLMGSNGVVQAENDDVALPPLANSLPSYSDSVLARLDNDVTMAPHMQGSFLGMFGSGLSHQMQFH